MTTRVQRMARPAHRLAIGLAALFLSLSTPAHFAQAKGESAVPDSVRLSQVMERLAASGGIAARFSESRQLAILEEPIVSSGWLYFAPPDALARHVESPGLARVVVRNDRVSFRDETGVQTLDLSSSEVARAMVGNVMLLMRGDLAAIEKQYDVRFSSEQENWTLDLEPRNKLLRGMIERLRVLGSGDRLVRMQTLETSGDETTTRFSDVRVGVEFSAEERERIFSVEETQNSADENAVRLGLGEAGRDE